MSRSKRDKRAHKARNPEKYFGEEVAQFRQIGADFLFDKGIYPTKDYPKIAWSIIGKRRRNSTRKGNQKVKQMVHQMERAKSKVETQKIINNSKTE